MFADDTKLYKAIENENDCETIQTDLDNLSEWSDTWQLKFNATKCKSLHIGRINSKHKYHMKSGESEIEQVENEKDIGVTFDDKMKFNIHIADIVKKAMQPTFGISKEEF